MTSVPKPPSTAQPSISAVTVTSQNIPAESTTASGPKLAGKDGQPPVDFPRQAPLPDITVNPINSQEVQLLFMNIQNELKGLRQRVVSKQGNDEDILKAIERTEYRLQDRVCWRFLLLT